MNNLGEHSLAKKPLQCPVSGGQEQLWLQDEAIICSESSFSEPCQIDVAKLDTAITRAEETTEISQPPEAGVQSLVTVSLPSETALESCEASHAAQAVQLPHQLQENDGTQAEGSTMDVDMLVGSQPSDCMTSTSGEPLGSDSQVDIEDSVLTLKAPSVNNPKKISLSSYILKKARQMEQTRAEGPILVPQGDDQHTTELETMGDGSYITRLKLQVMNDIDEANAEETIIAATRGSADASASYTLEIETQSPTPPHSHDNPSAETVVAIDILDKTIDKPDIQALVLGTAKQGSSELKAIGTYSKFQPGCLPQSYETFGSPEPEACEVGQEVGGDVSLNSRGVEEYPMLPNPIMPQLGTGGAIARFLQSKESDKAAEWSFWGSTAAPKVNFTLVKPLAPRDSGPVPSIFRIVGPKPKISLPQQSKTVIMSSHTKAMNNQPTAGTTVATPEAPIAMPDLSKFKQPNIAGQPAAEVVLQRNAIFLTDDGNVTTFPPGAAAASSDTYVQNAGVEMKDGEVLVDVKQTQGHGHEAPTELFPQPFVDRLRELEDIQYDTLNGEKRSDGVEYKARDVDRDASRPPGSPVGGQLPAALRCPECLRFHHGRCSRPSLPCILCGGQHWVKQCNCKSLRLAKTYRPGISCTKCHFMHKNKCPTKDACPICLQVHEDLCFKPSGTCRYCGSEHWENSCPRWEQLDEEMGFYKPEEDNAFKVEDMAERVAKFWSSEAPYFDNLGGKQQERLDIGPRECITQDDFLKVVDRRDELRRLPPTYANAKAVKRDLMSALLGKNGQGFANAGKRGPAYSDHSPIHRENEMKVCRTPSPKTWRCDS